jgi:hypothetical protein
MKNGGRKIVLASLALATATVKWCSVRDGWDQPLAIPPPDPRIAPSTAKGTPAPSRSEVVAPRQFADPARAAIAPESGSATEKPPVENEQSHLADELHSPERTGAQDVAVVMNLFTQYRMRFHSFPAAEDNPDFVHALTGHNPGQLALLPPNHPAIDARGRLVDRWAQPFFFHLLSRNALEIRSAGPDQRFYTADDLVKGSSQAREVSVALKGN